jgi:DNA-binding Lrp family transcriptional regulator
MVQTIDRFLDDIQSIVMSFLVKLGPFCVALMPALFTGYSIYFTFRIEAGSNLALFFAIVVGLAMETVGIVATHTALDLYNAVEEGYIKPVKFKLMVLLVPVYILGASAVVLFSENAFTPLVKSLGVASPFLTVIVYVAVALARDIRRAEAKQDKTESRQDKEKEAERKLRHEKEVLEIRLKHEENLAKIDAKNARKADDLPAKISENSPQVAKNTPPIRVAKNEWRVRAVETLRHNPEISGAELGRRLGANARTGQNIINELIGKGVIQRGEMGWDVLDLSLTQNGNGKN